jgi:hypothetical protein
VSGSESAASTRQPPRYFAPVVGEATRSPHLAAACQLAERDSGQVVALIVGLVPSSLPMGSDVPELWSRLEYEAARARRFGRQQGVEIETVLVLSDSVVRLAEECEVSAVCLAYEPDLRAAVRRWRDPLWRTVLDRSPVPVVLECVRPIDEEAKRGAELARAPWLTARR